MNGTNLIKIAIRALANNKLRGFLTMLGIIIGVASVITMLAIGQGSKRSIQAQISEMGSNMIMIHPGADVRGGVRQDASAMETLKLQDYEDIVDETRFVSAVSPSVNSSGQAIYGANNAPDHGLRHQSRLPGDTALQSRGRRHVHRTGHPDSRQSMRGRQDRRRQPLPPTAATR